MDNLICIVDEKLDIGEKKNSKQQQKFNEKLVLKGKRQEIVSFSFCDLFITTV